MSEYDRIKRTCEMKRSKKLGFVYIYHPISKETICKINEDYPIFKRNPLKNFGIYYEIKI